MTRSLTDGLPTVSEIERTESVYNPDRPDNIPFLFIKAALRAHRLAKILDRDGYEFGEAGKIYRKCSGCLDGQRLIPCIGAPTNYSFAVCDNCHGTGRVPAEEK